MVAPVPESGEGLEVGCRARAAIEAERARGARQHFAHPAQHAVQIALGQTARASHRLELFVSPSPLLVSVVSGARLSPGTGPGRAKYRQLHRTPWLFAASLPHHRRAGDQIKRIYAQRMQIEEDHS